jgi:phosphoserine phosphatase
MKYSFMQSFKTIFFDFDSTLVSIEGIDELARLNGVYDVVSELTTQAMNGDLTFDEVLLRRLELIKPTQQDLKKVGELYLRHLVPGVKETIQELHNLNITIHIVSGGYKEAILPTARYLGIESKNVHALTLLPDDSGFLTRVEDHPLTRHDGKQRLISSLNCDRATALIGDGHSDVSTQSVVDRFIAFTGVVTRTNVVGSTPFVLNTFTPSQLNHCLKQ